MKHTQFLEFLQEQVKENRGEVKTAYINVLEKYIVDFKLELLQEESATIENDFKALAIQTQIIREKREERWENWMWKIIESDEVKSWEDINSKYTLTTKSFGTIDYFFKSNKLLIRKDNEWKEKGLNWLITNLIKNDGKDT